jgi:hypothetical protein
MAVYHRDDRYPMVRVHTPGDWDALQSLTDGRLGRSEIAKFRELLGDSCRTIIVERDYVCKDYRDTYTNYYAKKFASYPDKCVRLLFFKASVQPDRWWDVPSYADTFVGYSVVRPTRITPVGRTILDPTACRGARGFLCRTDFTANLMGARLTVSGFPHISQDTDVTVCAHAACWACFRYFSERYPTYSEIYPYQVTQLTMDLSNGRLLPSRGVFMEQVVEMFSRFGFHPRVYFREDWGNRFDRMLYYYVESGLPLVLGLDPDHAVTAIGHTADFQIDAPSGLAFSDHYLTGVVINDDNSLPYETLPHPDHEDRFLDLPHVSTRVLSQVDSFVVPLYEKVYLAAEDVEDATLRLLRDPEVGLSGTDLSEDQLIVRIFLTTSRAYKMRRRGSPLPHDLSRLYTRLPMPKFVWVSELSTQTLYPQGKILGEILWDATASDQDHFSWLVIHYPGRLLVNDRTSDTAGITGIELPEVYCLRASETFGG